MANGQQKAEHNVQAFKQWVATMQPDDFAQIAFRGKLKRGEVAKALGCAKSALTQNPHLRQLLDELEADLREQGYLPEPVAKAAQTTKEEPRQHDQYSRLRDLNADRINKLEQRIVELEAENKQLKKEQTNLSELSEVLADTGRLL